MIVFRRNVGVKTWFPLGWGVLAWDEDVRRAFAALGWTVRSIGPMPNTDYDWIEMTSDGRELEPSTLGNLLTELGLTSGEYSFDLQGFKHKALTFVDADWWERCRDPRGLIAVVNDVAHDRQLRKAPNQIGERKGWLTILALRAFCRHKRSGEAGSALRLEELGEYLDALDRGAAPEDARFRWFLNQAPLRLAHQAIQYALEDLREALSKENSQQLHGATEPERVDETAKTKVAAIVRDIFGNPFRPATINPAWLSWNNYTVPRIAREIYDERQFGRLPILADILEEAGCDNGEILTHCRGGEHVRGCWVVDLLLSKG